MTLEQGEEIYLSADGPVIRRGSNCDDAYQISNHGDELYRDEIKRLAELAGFEVNDG